MAGLLQFLFRLICGSDKPQLPGGPAQQHQQQQQQPHRPQQQHPHRPPHAARPPQEHQPPQQPAQAPAHQAPHRHRPGVNENAANQQNEYYRGLRDRANAAGDAMARCFAESREAYAAHDGARAKELSNEGKAHQREMERLNMEASDWIFKENNTDSEPGEVDLHGLYVKEAITYTDRAIQDARSRGDRDVRLIVGKGLHSSGHIAKLKPAIEELMQKHALSARLDPHNEGVLIVQLDSSQQPGMGADEIARKLESDRESCIIM